MKRTNKFIWIGLCITGIVPVTEAGSRREASPVFINDVTHTASGSLGGPIRTAHNYIGCELYGRNDSAACYAYGEAFDGITTERDGERFCWTSNPEHLAVIRSMQDDSMLTFRWNDDADCTHITVISNSQEAPRPSAPASPTSGLFVLDDIRGAGGTLGEIHDSVSTRAFIECDVFAALTGQISSGCRFVNDNTPQNFFYQCASSDPVTHAKLRALTGSSYLQVRWEGDALRPNASTELISAVCSVSLLRNSSFNVAKQR